VRGYDPISQEAHLLPALPFDRRDLFIQLTTERFVSTGAEHVVILDGVVWAFDVGLSSAATFNLNTHWSAIKFKSPEADKLTWDTITPVRLDFFFIQIRFVQNYIG